MITKSSKMICLANWSLEFQFIPWLKLNNVLAHLSLGVALDDLYTNTTFTGSMHVALSDLCGHCCL